MLVYVHLVWTICEEPLNGDVVKYMHLIWMWYIAMDVNILWYMNYMVKSIDVHTCWKIFIYRDYKEMVTAIYMIRISWVIHAICTMRRQTVKGMWKDINMCFMLTMHCIRLKGTVTVYSSHCNSDVGGIVLRGSIAEVCRWYWSLDQYHWGCRWYWPTDYERDSITEVTAKEPT